MASTLHPGLLRAYGSQRNTHQSLLSNAAKTFPSAQTSRATIRLNVYFCQENINQHSYDLPEFHRRDLIAVCFHMLRFHAFSNELSHIPLPPIFAFSRIRLAIAAFQSYSP